MIMPQFTDYRMILQLHARKFGVRAIARATGHSRSTVQRVLDLCEEKGITWEDYQEASNADLKTILYPHSREDGKHAPPDMEYMYEQMGRRGVNLTLLHAEYVGKCEAEGTLPYGRTQFCIKYNEYTKKKKATLRIEHKPAERVEVDWVGDTMEIMDVATGKTYKAYVFVAVLPCSQYFYAEAFLNMKQESWITAHVHAFEFFGGVPDIICPDNLKAGIIYHKGLDYMETRAYRDMADYYETVILPARVRRGNDKPSAEGTVRITETWLMAALRDEVFPSLEALNKALCEKRDEYLQHPFQKRPGSRASAFEIEEKPFLRPLPEVPYDVPVWKRVTIQPDYLIEVDGCKYSVPFEYIGKRVDVCKRRDSICVYYEDQLLTSHVRRHTPQKEPVYLVQHMPPSHRKAILCNEDYYRKWAEDLGAGASAAMDKIFSEQPLAKALHTCAQLGKLGDVHTVDRLEKALYLLKDTHARFNIETVKSLLETHGDKRDMDVVQAPKGASAGFTRGAAYYSGGQKK